MKHEQRELNAEWKIKHNFDHNPAIKCWVELDGDLIRIIPKSVVFDEGEIKITLTKPYLGEVLLVSSKAWHEE